mmetsp:Transcript_13089/g.39585  ORF Transcript_13089/g.39585 Transcript_13089/m.39585 type:complete len:124 (+) Transcript_13089:121-492(+)
MASLRYVRIFSRSLPSAVRFYEKGLGLQVLHQDERSAQLDAGDGGVHLLIEQAQSEAVCSTGYSPHLTFEVKDLDTTLPALLDPEHAAVMDGAVVHDPYMKMASIRSPDGQMIALVEVCADVE